MADAPSPLRLFSIAVDSYIGACMAQGSICGEVGHERGADRI
jgi:hypothetical protein